MKKQTPKQKPNAAPDAPPIPLPKVETDLSYAGIGNPKNFRAEATAEKNDEYREIRIGVFNPEKIVADVFVGYSGEGELRVLVTTNGEGDGDHQLAIYPERSADKAVEVW